ncbi:MAG: RICIN domain-containing protein [Bifidobacterium minimum]|nr:RICIN domain-containing protein [Bifidobacterium minimum]
MTVLFPLSSIGSYGVLWTQRADDGTSESTGVVVNGDSEVTGAQEGISADSMPDNPNQRLPLTVSGSIPNSATAVSDDLAVLKNGEIRNLSTGASVTDSKIVGTSTTPPDPLAKTDGSSFIPTSVHKVRAAMKKSASQAASGTVRQSAYISYGRNQTTSVAWTSSEYGAYWGSYNDSQAFFGASGDLFAQQANHVIDVSQWQGTIDWSRAKAAGVQGVIIRIGYGWGNDFDTQALRNIRECKRLGIPFGIYLYSYAYDTPTASNEGSDVVSKLRSAGVSPDDLSYPVFYDLENWTWTGHTPPTSSEVYEGMVNAWYAQLQAAGYDNLGVYSYVNYLQHELNSSALHAKTRWVADYGSELPFQFTTNDRGWQYSDQGSIDGISGTVDVSAFGNGQYRASTDVAQYSSVSVPDGTYYINSFAKDSSGVDITGGGIDDGVRTELHQSNSTTEQQYRFTRQVDGSYTIINVNSGKALDVSGGAAGNQAVVQQWAPNGTDAQKWYIRDSGEGYYIQSALGDWVLDIAGGSLTDGTSIRLYAPNGTDAQKFLLSSATAQIPVDKTVRIISGLNESLVIDLPGASQSGGTQLQLYPWNQTDAQLYTFHEVSNGVYRIVNSASGKNVEVGGASTVNGAAIQQWEANGTAAQNWSVIVYDDSSFALVNDASGKVVDVPSGNAVANAKLQSYAANGSKAQMWGIAVAQNTREMLDSFAMKHRQDLADGVAVFQTALASGKVLDVAGGSQSNGAEVRLWSSNGTSAQQWRVSHDQHGYVTLTNVGSGKVLDVRGGSTAIGTTMNQYEANGSYAQKWIAVKDSNGTLTLHSALKSGLVLDVSGAATADGTSVQLYSSNGTEAQRWIGLEG